MPGRVAPVVARGARARPSRAELEAARGTVVGDLVAPGLRVLFCGINPGLYSGAVGHHFARPGNRFWRALHESGFTSRLLAPEEEAELLAAGVGVTNLVPRATASADELGARELREGARRLEEQVERLRPALVCVLGVGAYHTAFGIRPVIGPQPRDLAGTGLWVLPNPSGLQARYQLPELVELFAALRADAARRADAAPR